VAVQALPGFLGLTRQFEDHGQCGQSGTAAFSLACAMPDGSESRFDGIGRSYVTPVSRRERIKGEQGLLILDQAGAGFGILVVIEPDEPIEGARRM
jgi:hypothetical protein